MQNTKIILNNSSFSDISRIWGGAIKILLHSSKLEIYCKQEKAAVYLNQELSSNYVCTSDSDRTFKMGGYDFSIKLDKTIEEKKNVGPGDILVYRCYIKNNVVFEIEANSSLIIEYEYN